MEMSYFLFLINHSIKNEGASAIKSDINILNNSGTF